MVPAVSIIVPVYKVEPYLRKCIDSICNQTLREIEIILVDDGSPDNCGKICDAYAAQDDRIRVIHKENGGLSSARNAGMAIAKADIFGFVDSDDWIEPDMFALLYHNLLKENADISVCGRYVHKNKKIKIQGNAAYSVHSSSEAIRNIFQLPGAGVAVWNKLYRRHLFSDIRFPEGRIYEDIFIMPRLMDLANRIVFDMQPKYHYLIRSGSITHRPYGPELFDCIEASWGNYVYIREKHPDLADVARLFWICSHFNVLIPMFLVPGRTDPEKELQIVRLLKENRWVLWASPSVPLKRKLVLLVLCIHPSLCKLLVQKLKK